jgi:demethylmenaquinone methyltransferase/2-methoxy-6-polyprenyl-1,4-benzoquinol methylase
MPFPDEHFDVVTAAFGFRNLANYRKGLDEIYRLLRPGGRMGILEFSMPERGFFGALYRFYFQSILPRVGNLVASRAGRIERPYTYLPSSVVKFPSCDGFAQWMEEAGFRNVRYARWTGGVVALHEGEKAAL